MTKTEQRIKLKIMVSLSKFSQSLSQIQEEVKVEIEKSDNHEEVKRLRTRNREISEMIQDTDRKYKTLEKAPILYLTNKPK